MPSIFVRALFATAIMLMLIGVALGVGGQPSADKPAGGAGVYPYHVGISLFLFACTSLVCVSRGDPMHALAGIPAGFNVFVIAYNYPRIEQQRTSTAYPKLQVAFVLAAMVQTYLLLQPTDNEYAPVVRALSTLVGIIMTVLAFLSSQALESFTADGFQQQPQPQPYSA